MLFFVVRFRWMSCLLALSLLLAARATAQTVTVLFDENDAEGADYYAASAGQKTGDDVLQLIGPAGDKMPLVMDAYRGDVAGMIVYRHAEGGSWTLAIRPADGGVVDFSSADSLVFFVNGTTIPRPGLPRVALEDAHGVRTAALALPLGIRTGYNAFRSGFIEGEADVQFAVRYLEALPEEQVRPGYPEDLIITFSDEVQGSSRPAIGIPATDARFTIATRADGLPLSFTFRDLNGDGTLGADGEFIQIYTPVALGSTSEVPTWELRVAGAPASVPGSGDVYLMSVLNAGVDADPATWQRVGLSLEEFGPLGAFDLSTVAAVRFSNGDAPTTQRTLLVDYVAGVENGEEPIDLPPPTATIQVGDSSLVLRWDTVPGSAGTHIYRQGAPDAPFVRRTAVPVTQPHFADLDAQNGTQYTYILRSVDSGGRQGQDSAPMVATPSAEAEDAFLDLLEETAFQFFWQEANPANGLIRDRTGNLSLSSIAAVGFGLSAYTVGIERGWITREEGIARTLATLRFFWTAPQSNAPDATGYKGFFYHFLNMDTGRRAGTTELSTIDTALLLGGVLHVGEYFDGAGADEEEIRALADSIFARVDWTWAQARPPAISHGWRPENGFIGNDWIGYNEAMILYILALGSPTHPVEPAAWDRWVEGYQGQWQTLYGYTFLTFPPLFGHQYSHLWIDFRGIQDAYMREKGIDYFENSRRATLAQRNYHIDNPRNWPNYGPNEWGLTASDIPGGYRARGAPPAQNDDGTIAPTAPGGSLPFAPEETLAALRHLYRTYPRLWGPYGFRDAFNVDQNWIATDYLGIDQGPILLMAENLRTERIWDVFMQHEAIQRGISLAGFEPVVTAVEPESPQPTLLLENYPNPFSSRTEIHYHLSQTGKVRLAIYDLLGREVSVLVDERKTPGEYAVTFEAGSLPSGLYFYRLSSPAGTRTGKMVRVK